MDSIYQKALDKLPPEKREIINRLVSAKPEPITPSQKKALDEFLEVLRG